MKKLFSLFILLFSLLTAYSQWQQLKGPQGGSIKLIEVNDELIFACGGSGRLFYSTDNGENWFQAYSKNMFGKITYLDLSGNKIYASASDGVYVSSVTGANIFAAVYGEGVYKSTNEGQDWIETDSGLTDKNINCFAIKDNQIFAGTNNGIYLSTDLGDSWSFVDSVLLYKTINNIVVNGDNIYTSTYGWGIFMSSDMGQSWSSISGDLPYIYVQALTVKENNIYAGTSNGIFLSTNNGQNWIWKGLTESNVFELAVDNGNLYAAGYKSGMSISTDDGITWTSLNSGLPADPSIRTFKINGNNIFAGMYSNKDGVYVSTDLGVIWKVAKSGLPSAIVLDFLILGNKVFVGTSLGIYLSTNNGSNWTLADSFLSSFSITALVKNGANIYAGTEQGLFLSTDAGGSWSIVDSTMKDSLTIYSLSFSENKIFAGTKDKGIFYSSDNGISWININSNLNILSGIYNIVIYGKNIFIVFGGYADQGWRCPGLFLSTDNGESWTEINSGMTNTCIGNLAIKDDYIFASTAIGVFKAKLSDFELNDIEEKPVTNSDGFYISPNPADDYISINLQDIARKTDFVRLFDYYGNMVYEKNNINENNFKFNISKLASSMYMLQISTGGGILSRKVVVVH